MYRFKNFIDICHRQIKASTLRRRTAHEEIRRSPAIDPLQHLRSGDLIGFGRIFDRHLGARLFHGVAAMAAFVGVRDVTLAGTGGVSAAASGGASGEAFSSGEGSGLPYSPAKMKAAYRGRAYYSLLLLPRLRKLAKVRILLAAGVVLAILLLARQVGPLMGWNYHTSLSSDSSSRFHIPLCFVPSLAFCRSEYFDLESCFSHLCCLVFELEVGMEDN